MKNVHFLLENMQMIGYHKNPNLVCVHIFFCDLDHLRSNLVGVHGSFMQSNPISDVCVGGSVA